MLHSKNTMQIKVVLVFKQSNLSGTVGWVHIAKCGRFDSIPGCIIPKIQKNGTCDLCRRVLSTNWWVSESSSWTVLLLTHHQCSIHSHSNRVTPGASKVRYSRPQMWHLWK